MRYDRETSLRGESRGCGSDWFAFAQRMKSHRSEDVRLFSATIYDFCERLHIRAEVVMAFAALASNDWHSYVWNTRCNPYGSWCSREEADKNFGSGERAARAVMVNVWLLMSGRELPAELSPYRHLDVLWGRTISSGCEGSIKTVGKLSHHYGVHWDAINDILNEDLPFIIKESHHGTCSQEEDASVEQ